MKLWYRLASEGRQRGKNLDIQISEPHYQSHAIIREDNTPANQLSHTHKSSCLLFTKRAVGISINLSNNTLERERERERERESRISIFLYKLLLKTVSTAWHQKEGSVVRISTYRFQNHIINHMPLSKRTKHEQTTILSREKTGH